MMTQSGRLSDPTTILDLDDDEMERTHQRITSFIAETTAAAGADGAVLGLSGGLDSTLTAYLTVDALGPEGLHGLVMPGTVSREDNMSDAETVATDLGISHDVIEIEPIVDTFLTAYPEATGDQLAVGNARARTRAVLNYLVANHEDRLVLGTGNRSEAMVGYFTKFGDQAVDCNPIGNLYKCQVRALARYVGVPEAIIEKEPTAGLWAGQTDEGELGLSYEQLDAILALHVDGPADVSATATVVGVDESTVAHVDNLVQGSGHKRSMPPTPQS